MASLDQVIQQVRFGLEQLRSKNAHHEFEHLCRHYARTRICSNILPATGPVSAGGDQARDFETFRSYLAGSPIANSSFVGRVANDPVAFQCTLQKESIDTKIKDDVATITASGTKVLGIHYFCVVDVPVGKRHELQSWAHDTHGVELEIHDGQALAENIAQKDVFWIAARYLSIPSEIYPRDLFSADESYEQARANWQTASVDCASYPQFHELKGLLRYATWEESVKQDLPFWIARIQEFNGTECPLALARRAIYEAAVATLRGLGTLVGHEGSVREYFREIPSIADLDELEDYAVLLSYCTSAAGLGQAEFTLQELREWRSNIIRQLEVAIRERTFPSTQAQLLRIRGSAALHIVTESGIRIAIDETLDWWSRAVDLIPQAPLFPLESFADLLTAACPFMGRHPRFRALTESVDEALSTRFGGFTAAEKCRDRAVAHHDAGRILDAIAEVHKAKTNWFADETLPAFIITMLVLSRWYTELGLCLAGKYHALAASAIAIRSNDPKVKMLTWRCLLEAGNGDYALGAWAGFLDLTTLALLCHHNFSDDPGNFDVHPDLNALFYHACIAEVVSERLSPQLGNLVKTRIQEWHLGELHDQQLAVARKGFADLSDAELTARVEEQLCGIPVNDVGVNRIIAWAALGVEWSIEWLNEYATTVFAEQFVASLQILQAEMVQKDLCLPHTRVEILFVLEATSSPSVDPLPCTEGLRWKVTWPKNAETADLDTLFVSVFAASICLLNGVSFLPEERLHELLEELFKDGIPAKTFVGQTYANIYRETVPEELFNRGRRVLAVPKVTIRSSPLSSHPNLAAPVGPGPGYSPEESRSQIAHRYQRIASHLNVTLRRLRECSDFQAMVMRLREKGWRDWHILGAVFSAVINFRAHKQHGPLFNQESAIRIKDELTATGELPEASEIPLNEFSEEQLDFYRRINLAAIIRTWGLDFHHPTLPPKLIEDFLASRYGYWSDDVEHPDLFGV
jgi:hypothetical protein